MRLTSAVEDPLQQLELSLCLVSDVLTRQHSTQFMWGRKGYHFTGLHVCVDV